MKLCRASGGASGVLLAFVYILEDATDKTHPDHAEVRLIDPPLQFKLPSTSVPVELRLEGFRCSDRILYTAEENPDHRIIL